MYSSRDLIAVLLSRPRRRLWFRNQQVEVPPGEFPPGWRDWFAALRQRPGTVRGAPATDFVAIFLGRELSRPPPRSGDLSRWQVFTTLWRQQWHASEPGDARDRIAATTISLFVHLLFLLVMSLLIYMSDSPVPAPLGEDVVQVEFIGEGTPEDSGGGAPQADTAAEPAQAAAAASSPPAAAPAASATPAPSQPAPAAPAQPAPEPPQPQVAQQPLQVTETPVPDMRFVLPPTTLPQQPVVIRERARPQVDVVQREVDLAQVPSPPMLRPQVVDVRAPAPQVPQPQTQVRNREIPLLTRPRDTPQLAQSSQPAPSVQAPPRQIQTREVPLNPGSGRQPAPQAASGSTAANPSPSGTAPAPGQAAPGGRPEAAGGGRPAVAAGRGASPSTAPGAWPTPQRGDDWGDSDRNRPGGNAGSPSGLFNADGSPRLPPGTAAAGGGFPPGSDNWSRDQLDRYGTWSKRPPIGYDPTRFDQYWIPSGTLLEEWVRRGIKSLAIPIPGTSKKINCTISILQLGGGCGISDPNLQDQEAEARAAPDIPYKPELQEGGN